MVQFLFGLFSLINSGLASSPALLIPIADELVVRQATVKEELKKEEVLTSVGMDLDNSYESEFVAQVFKDNILLALEYLGKSFILQPGEVFAFHENVLAEYRGRVVKTIGSEFNTIEGYRSSGFIVGDGVCHLASLMNWAALEAGLKTEARVDHSFRLIPGIPKEYQLSIRYSRFGNNSQNQNLYIVNNFDFPVEFKFEEKANWLNLKVITTEITAI